MRMVVEPRWGSLAIRVPIPGGAARPWAVLLDRFAVMERFALKAFRTVGTMNGGIWGGSDV